MGHHERILHNDEPGPRPGFKNVGPLRVVREPHLRLRVRAYHRGDNEVRFIALEGVDRVDQ